MRGLAFVLALLAGTAAEAASSSLDDTWWAADGCYLTDILFKGGKVSVFFQDGRDDGGSYQRMGTTLTIILERFKDDEITGRFLGTRTLRIAHRWREDPRAPLSTESCDFEPMFGSQT